MSNLTITVSAVGIAIGFPAVYVLYRDGSDALSASRHITSIKSGDLSQGSGKRFCSALRNYVTTFNQAVDRKLLLSFDVDRQLNEVRRVAGTLGASLRALAGVLILCGLIVTLFNLQHAVGGLRATFDQLAAQQSNADSGGDTASQVVAGMSTVATAAGKAFQISFFAILVAAVLLLLSLAISACAQMVLRKFSDWALGAYRDELRLLPEQVPLNVVAAEFKASAQALERLTSSFAEMTSSFGALQGFADSMDRARNAIVETMQKLPAHIQQSMGTLSERFVSSVTEGLRETSEHTQQILLIYGQQQQRIDKVQAEIVAIREFSNQVRESVSKLEGLPENVAAVATGVQLQSTSLNAFESTVAELAIRVEDLPVKELRAEVAVLQKATEGIHNTVTSVAHFGEEVAANTQILRSLPELAQEIVSAVNREADNAAAFRASAGEIGKAVKELPVSELRAGLVGLTNATEKVGNIHAQTIAAVEEITRRSSALESAENNLKSRVEEVLKYCNQLAVHQQQIKSSVGEHANKISEALLLLTNRLNSEIDSLKHNEQLRGLEEAFDRLSAVVNTIKLELGAISATGPETVEPPPESGVTTGAQN